MHTHSFRAAFVLLSTTCLVYALGNEYARGGYACKRSGPFPFIKCATSAPSERGSALATLFDMEMSAATDHHLA
jgi:hypothetical protein